jgi:Uncharacterised protein family (UPF0167)
VELPRFTYHPDPRATGFVVESNAICLACGAARGHIYTGPVYAVEELAEAICPWCIADGTAADRFDAEFTDVGSYVPEDVQPESSRRSRAEHPASRAGSRSTGSTTAKTVRPSKASTRTPAARARRTASDAATVARS